MSLNFISILILIWLAFRDTTKPNKPTYNVLPIILALVFSTAIDHLYAGSSWYLKPLLNQQYLTVYIWCEIPSFAVIFIWPFYKLIIQEIWNVSFKNYFYSSIAELKNKIVIGARELFLALCILTVYLAVLFSIENLLVANEVASIEQDSFRKSLLKFANSPMLSFLFILDDIVLYPLAEELFFRGYCYNALKERFGVTASIALSATLFSLYHNDIMATIPYFILGVFLARAYKQSGSLISPFIAHALYNILFSYLLFN